jgi:hypothetical protein
MRRNSRILDVFTQLASRLRMQPTVIGPRARSASYALGRCPIARTVVELLGLNREPRRGAGLKVSTRVLLLSVDAVGFEPTASPLQGERSTADLRAPRGTRRFALSYFKDSSQAPAGADGLRCLLHSVNASPHGQCPRGQAQGSISCRR